MAWLNDEGMDQGMDWVQTTGTRLHLVSTDPSGTYATVTGNDLGNAAVTLTGPANGATDGRSVTCPETTITPSGTDTATHWAITNNSDTVVASGALSSSQVVLMGVDVTVAAFACATHRDPS